MSFRKISWDDFFSLQRFGMTPNLDNIRSFSDYLGHPERSFPCIHVGGTNGKGSVVATLSSVYHAAGYKVGMYTSPHILKFNERIRISERAVDDSVIFAFLEKHWDFIQNHSCTFFETATALALDIFREEQVDIAVVEVGLGGTFDATRIVEAILTMLTRIDFDHMDRLGDTLPKIAADKAGIFRSGVPTLVSDQHPDVIPVLRERATAVGSELFTSTELVTLSSTSLTPQGISGNAMLKCLGVDLSLENFTFPLTGAFQIENLRTALASICLLKKQFPQLDVKSVARGLQRVKWLARLQTLRQNPTVVLDVGHNTGAVKCVLSEIRRIWQPHTIRVIFSALRDKDIIGMMTIFRDEGITGFVVPLPLPRGLMVDELERYLQQSHWRATIITSSDAALNQALAISQPEDLILLIGSHYLAEEFLKTRN